MWLLLWAALLVPGATARSTYLHFDLENNSTAVRLARGDTLSLGFYSILSTGYSWTRLGEDTTHAGVLNFTAFRRQEAPPDNFMWNATAVRSGTENLTFVCGTPWSGVAQTVKVQVVCK